MLLPSALAKIGPPITRCDEVDVLPHDGVKHTGAAIRDLTDKMPRTVDDAELDPVIGKIEGYAAGLPWVQGWALRLREEGRFPTGTLYVVPAKESVSSERIEELHDLDRSIHDASIVLVSKAPKSPHDE